MKTTKLSQLKKLNFIASGLHFVQGFAILALSKDFPVTVVGNFLSFNNDSQTLEPATTELFNLQLPYLIALFFFLSSFFHFVIATVYSKKYESDLKIGLNRMRWLEYSLSASIMMVAIAILVGMNDFSSLLMVFGLTAVMNLLGLVMEIHNQTTKKTSWISYWVGTLAGILPWAAVAQYLWVGRDNGSTAPTFVYWIFVSIFVFFSCFAVNMALQYEKIGKWSDYIYGEKAYIVLSLVAKTLLAWQVFGGTLRP